MAVYETIFNFVRDFIVGADSNLLFNSSLTSLWDMYFLQIDVQAGSDGRLIPISFNFLFDAGPFLGLLTHFLTILACVSLCVMLWKLITLPIRYFSNRVK